MDIPGPGPRASDPPPVANIRFDTSVKPSDVSTSIVVDVSADPQIALGQARVAVSPSQTLLLHEALRAAGADSCRWVLKDADHGDMPFLGPEANVHYWSTTTVMAAVVAFFERILKLPVEPAGAPRG